MALICLVASNMSLVTSWSAMGSMNKLMNDMKELDTVSGLPSQIRQPKILQGNSHFIQLTLPLTEHHKSKYIQ